MNKTFFKIKLKSQAVTLIKTIGVGVAGGAAVLGACLIGNYYGKNPLADVWVVLLCIVGVLLGGGVTYLLTHKSSKKLAKSIDDEYGLNESVQTMLEYDGQEGDIVLAQRQDTAQKLANVKWHKPTFKKLWQYLAVGALSSALLVSGLVIPVATAVIGGGGAQGEPEDPIIEIDDFQERSLRSLINNVSVSNLDEQTKVGTLAALQTLLDIILENEGVLTGTLLYNSVITTVIVVDTLFASINTHLVVASEYESYEELIPYATISRVAVAQYLKTIDNVTQYDQVTDIEKYLKEFVEESISQSKDNILATMKKLSKDEMVLNVNGIIPKMLMALEKCQEKDLEEDPVYLAYASFTENLQGAVQYYLDNYNDVYDAKMVPAFNNLMLMLVDPLTEQAYNSMMNDYVRNSLAIIFGLGLDELPSKPGGGNIAPPEADDEGTGEEQGSGGGGAAEMETQLGSNALVWDPEQKKYVPCSQLLLDDKKGYYNELSDIASAYAKGEDAQQQLASYIDLYMQLLMDFKAE